MRSSSIERGLPGRSSSYKPAMRSFKNRRRHFPTVVWLQSKRRATARLLCPAAHASTIRARKLSAAGIERERANDDNCACSASLKINFAFGRPIAIAVSPVGKIPQ